jgi:hypothetical protein
VVRSAEMLALHGTGDCADATCSIEIAAMREATKARVNADDTIVVLFARLATDLGEKLGFLLEMREMEYA